MRSFGNSLVILVVAGLAVFASSQTYTIVNLSPLSPFDSASAYGINSSGQITGAGYTNATGELDAFVYSNGVFTNLGMLGYPYGADGDHINDSGQIAGTGYGPGYHALLDTNGTVHQLGSIDGGYSSGLSLNNLGNIVGRAQNGDGGYQGFTYIGGHFTALNVDIARGINDSNDYVGSVGYYWTYGGYGHSAEHGFVNIGGTLTDIGDIGGGARTNTEAFSINNADQVTGYSTAADGTIHAILYGGGVLTDLGTFAPYYTYGISINNSGQIVGNIETYVGGDIGVFLYSNGVMQNLVDISDSSIDQWTGMTASQINDKGYIIGNGDQGGFLAIPVFTDIPVSYSISRGSYDSGSVGSLVAIDGDYLEILGLPGAGTIAPQIQVVFHGTSSVAAPASLNLSLTAHVTQPDVTQKIELWDYQASNWVLVNSQSASTVDSTVVGTGSNPGRFVQAGTNAVQARVSWRLTRASRIPFWLAGVDQLVWTISP